MSYWIFKLSKQEQYPDDLGKTYVYDNRHSIRVSAGDYFVYPDKRGGGYGFTGHGTVTQVLTKAPGSSDLGQPNISRIYTAKLGDSVQYARSLDIRPARVEGKRNRASLGITDVNKLGWSRSIAQISPDMYSSIVELAYRRHCIAIVPPDAQDYAVPDAWSLVRQRHSVERFKETVLLRQGFACAICGTMLREVLDVAHISKYSTDVKNRANPANGIGLCAYCHRAFDEGVFRLYENGVVSVADDLGSDPIALAHLSNLSIEARRKLLNGIDLGLLRNRQRGARQ